MVSRLNIALLLVVLALLALPWFRATDVPGRFHATNQEGLVLDTKTGRYCMGFSGFSDEDLPSCSDLAPSSKATPFLSAWNRRAITATVDSVGTYGGENKLYVDYVFENLTDRDYEVGPNKSIQLFLILKRQGSLSRPETMLKIDRPIFLPAKGRAIARLHLPSAVPRAKDILSILADPDFRQLPKREDKIEVLDAVGEVFSKLTRNEQERIVDCLQSDPYDLFVCATDEMLNSRQAVLKGHAAHVFLNVEGFVLFDKSERYQIDLPKAW